MSRSRDQPPVHELDRADVEPARRLRGDQQLRVARRSRARCTTFCWLPPDSEARERACGRRRARRTPAAAAARARACASATSQPRRDDRRLAVVAQREVLGQREVEHQPAPVAVLGDVADAGVEWTRARRAPRDVVPADRDPSRTRRRAARRSPRPARAGRCRRRRRSPTISPAAHRQRQAAARPRARGRRATRRSSHLEHRLAGLGGRLLDAQQHVAADHQPREARARWRPAVGTVSIFLPRRSTVTRSAISSTSSSLWVMKTIDVPVVAQRAQHPEQLVRSPAPSARRSARRGRGCCASRYSALAGSRRAAACRPSMSSITAVRVDREAVALRQLAHALRAPSRSPAARRVARLGRRARCSRPPSSPGRA